MESNSIGEDIDHLRDQFRSTLEEVNKVKVRILEVELDEWVVIDFAGEHTHYWNCWIWKELHHSCSIWK
jgi:hypothetical protein